MNLEYVEADLVSLCQKYKIGHMIATFRDGQDMRIRTIASSELDKLVAGALHDVIEKAVENSKGMIDTLVGEYDGGTN